jgi:hypothetical protein
MDFTSFIKDSPLWFTITLGAIYIVIWVVAIWAFFRMFRKN